MGLGSTRISSSRLLQRCGGRNSLLHSCHQQSVVVPALLWFCAVPRVICLLFLLAGILARLNTSLGLGSSLVTVLQSHQNRHSAESLDTWGDSWEGTFCRHEKATLNNYIAKSSGHRTPSEPTATLDGQYYCGMMCYGLL